MYAMNQLNWTNMIRGGGSTNTHTLGDINIGTMCVIYAVSNAEPCNVILSLQSVSFALPRRPNAAEIQEVLLGQITMMLVVVTINRYMLLHVGDWGTAVSTFDLIPDDLCVQMQEQFMHYVAAMPDATFSYR